MTHLRDLPLQALPLRRCLAAVLLFLLAATAVHGSASAASPVVAIASGPSSIGAALLHQSVSVGGRSGGVDVDVDVDVDRRDRRLSADQPRRPEHDQAMPMAAPTGVWVASPAASQHAVGRSADRSRARLSLRDLDSRAPPRHRPPSGLNLR